MNILHKRFWIHYNGGLVKLSFKEGELFHHRQGSRSWDGYSWVHTEYRREGDDVFMEVLTDSRDCDGRVSSEDLYKLGGFHVKPDGVILSDWQPVSNSQQDEYAEAMGY